ncbi:TetR/AcrR family transcriptional regulator [Neptuniibacter halophilus]|uniref:TetR/AcrR family transcriptional regulator n=1 Tax=Neptuniibacter halophilus TaxID=651666 RepID=UPI002572CF6A|nr:TetR/AcrR family transcriptional regulator [Neptuniibacter halophilus]
MKQQSRDKILSAAGQRMRIEGLDGSGIAAVMKDAGLTHGAFYSHFKNKDEMLRDALHTALDDNRKRWIGRPKKEPWSQRLARLAKRYLTPGHRNDLSNSCALASLCSEAARSNDAFRQNYEKELLKSLTAVCGEAFSETDKDRSQQSLAFMSLIIGSLVLSRAVYSEELSDRLLQAGQATAERLSADINPQPENQTAPTAEKDHE